VYIRVQVSIDGIQHAPIQMQPRLVVIDGCMCVVVCLSCSLVALVIVGLLLSTFQHISKAYLGSVLDLSGDELNAYIAKREWQTTDDRVSFPLTKDNQAKQKELKSSIKFTRMCNTVLDIHRYAWLLLDTDSHYHHNYCLPTTTTTACLPLQLLLAYLAICHRIEPFLGKRLRLIHATTSMHHHLHPSTTTGIE
jgi:hypothetical protein